MARYDPRGLVASARNSSYYSRPTAADETIRGVIGFGFFAFLLLTFGAIVLAAFLGETLSKDIAGRPFLAVLFLGAVFFVLNVLGSSKPVFIRALLAIVGNIASIALIIYVVFNSLEVWYMFLPAFLYAELVATTALWQLRKSGTAETP